MSKDRIEEIQERKKSREKGMQAWADMLGQLHAREPGYARQTQEANGGGGSFQPRDNFLPNPKTQIGDAARLAAFKASQAGPQDIKDEFQAQRFKRADPPVRSQSEPEAPKVAPPKAPEAAFPQAVAAPVVVHQPTAQNHLEREEPSALLNQNSKEAADELSGLLTAAGIQAPKQTRESGPDMASTSTSMSMEEALAAADDAVKLAALRSGVGADPSKAAKEYVLASDIPGVKDTLQGGIYEDFRVAL